jgi:hypothetical protein
MPITINDCIGCGMHPTVFPISEDEMRIACLKPNCENLDIVGVDIKFLVDKWNELNGGTNADNDK